MKSQSYHCWCWRAVSEHPIPENIPSIMFSLDSHRIESRNEQYWPAATATTTMCDVGDSRKLYRMGGGAAFKRPFSSRNTVRCASSSRLWPFAIAKFIHTVSHRSWGERIHRNHPDMIGQQRSGTIIYSAIVGCAASIDSSPIAIYKYSVITGTVCTFSHLCYMHASTHTLLH